VQGHGGEHRGPIGLEELGVLSQERGRRQARVGHDVVAWQRRQAPGAHAQDALQAGRKGTRERAKAAGRGCLGARSHREPDRCQH
jgi:hypothetical protein